MAFCDYLRWDGGIAVLVGVALCAFGLSEGHQAPVDALISGAVMLAGTGLFVVAFHEASFTNPGSWFTATPLAEAAADSVAGAAPALMVGLLAETVILVAVALGLSYATGFWLTYVDFGVWAVAIGAIKLGPARAAIARREALLRTTYRVSRRPVRGLVELSED